MQLVANIERYTMLFRSTLKSGIAMMELVIYIAILAILAMAVVPTLLNKLDKAKVSTTQTNLQSTKQAIMAFYTDAGRYPETLSDLMRKPLDDNLAKKWHGPYLDMKDEDDVPVDGWGNELVYRRLEPGSGKPYELYSYGSNGEDSPGEEWIYA